MFKLNKLEKLLDSIVDGKKPDDENPNLVFDLGEYLLIFSRDDDSYMCYIDCAAHDNYDIKSANYRQKFEFQLPLIHINNFLMKHIGEPQHNSHFLLTYPKSYNIESLDDVYNNFSEKINSEPKFFPAFLPGMLNEELPIKNTYTKKPKI
jgi:hypothetical protein